MKYTPLRVICMIYYHHVVGLAAIFVTPFYNIRHHLLYVKTVKFDIYQIVPYPQ